jgi:tetratricopeptide (TPR) repeat protein
MFLKLNKRLNFFPFHRLYSKDIFSKVKIQKFESKIKENEEELEVDVLSPNYRPKKIIPKPKVIVDRKKLILETFPNRKTEEIYSSLFQQGNEALESQQFTEASDKFSECISLDLNKMESYTQRSKAYLAKGEIELARKDLQFIIENSTNIDPSVYYNLALMTQDTQQGMDYYKKAIQMIESLKKEEEQTFQFNDLLLKCYNNLSKLYLNDKKYENALLLCNKAIELSKSKNLTRTREFYNRARSHHLLNNFKEAIEDYLEFLKFNQYNLTAKSFLSECYYSLKDYKKAIPVISSCIEIISSKPCHPDDKILKKQIRKDLNKAHHLRADYYFEDGEFLKALGDYTLAYENDRRDFEALKKKGHCYYQLKEYKEAIDQFSSTISLHPSVDSYILRSKAYIAMNKIQHSINDLIVSIFSNF